MPNMLDMADQSVLESITKTYEFGHLITNQTLQHPNVRRLLNSNEKFDLVIMEAFLNDAHLGNERDHRGGHLAEAYTILFVPF